MMIGSPVFDGLLDRCCVGIIVQCCLDECGQFLVARKSERKGLGSRDLMYPRFRFYWQEFLHPKPLFEANHPVLSFECIGPAEKGYQ